MIEFGAALRALRTADGMRQQDVIDQLGGQIARSTFANIEGGRERPSPRFWSLLSDNFPDWAEVLASAYAAARNSLSHVEPSRNGSDTTDDGMSIHRLGGPFQIEHIHYVYVFRHSRSPEEVLEVRTLKATATASGFGVKYQHTESSDFHLETEALWGGTLDVRERHAVPGGGTIVLATINFGRSLRRGQRHQFALRHWIERDPEPATEVMFSTTLPADAVDITLNFLGPDHPAEAWTFESLADDALVPKALASPNARPARSDSTITARFSKPSPGTTNGIGWTW